MRRGLSVLLLLAVTMFSAACSPFQGFRLNAGWLDTTHRLMGHVCAAAEDVFDSGGVLWGVRFVAAAVGQPCSTGAREINVPAALEAELRKARSLQVGQSVEVDGDLAARDLAAAQPEALVQRPTTEPLVARSIKIRTRPR